MSEWDDSVFDEVAERMENETQGKLSAAKLGYVEAERIDTIKKLRPYLCELAVPRGHKGMPKVNACKGCQSPCAYGRRLIVLVSENMKLAMEKKKEKQRGDETPAAPVEEAPQDGLCTVRLSRSQCRNAAEFIEYNLIDEIRRNTDIDNIAWIEDMIRVMNTLKNAGGNHETE